MKLRVVLTDDHPFVLPGLRSVRVVVGDIEVVGLARTASQLLQLFETVSCEVVAAHLAIPAASGEAEDDLRLVRRLRRDWPHIRVIVAPGVTNAANLRAMACAGVTGVLGKSAPMDQIEGIVCAAGQRHTSMRPAIEREFEVAGSRPAMRAPRLTPRKSAVIRRFAGGCTPPRSAHALGREVHTVSRQKQDAMAKLGVSNDAGLFAFARAYGLL